MQQPDVRGVCDDGAGDDQINQREPRNSGNILHPEMRELATHSRQRQQLHTSGEHLSGGAHGFRVRKNEAAADDGAN